MQSPLPITKITCVAAPNIAVIKYWGKRNQELMLPVNSSLSATLDWHDMCTKTTVYVSDSYKETEFYLNNKKQATTAKRFIRLMKSIRDNCGSNIVGFNGKTANVVIVSENNFPTAAGLASSAAGFACLAFCLCNLFKVPGGPTEWSKYARLGSGSACRSLYGGWVAWDYGTQSDSENKSQYIKNDGKKSLARQVAPEGHWDLDIIICVANAAKKHVPSTSGMQTSVDTSQLLDFRAKNIVPKRMLDMEKSILEKDFPSFAKLTMKDSNQFHAVCLDTYPPIKYMNDTSHNLINFIHSYNGETIKVAYTFDAGPNCVVYLPKSESPKFLSALLKAFPPTDAQKSEKSWCTGRRLARITENHTNVFEWANIQSSKAEKGLLSQIIVTGVGTSPTIVSDSDLPIPK